ncbi:hypothetical protein [Streptosporangium sp. NPDC000396]|uniref:hypothetical protein n=1 Tax=Streptosporangium sp. NPDC000396 TaxID=3366185 RepID=UPI0036A9EBDA
MSSADFRALTERLDLSLGMWLGFDYCHSRHARVQNGALLPLAKEGILKISKERLEQVFPTEWVRRLRDDLGGA